MSGIRRLVVDFVRSLRAVLRFGGLPAVAIRDVVLAVEGVLFHHRFADGHRDLVIVRVDFGESQEAMAISAIVYESGL